MKKQKQKNLRGSRRNYTDSISNNNNCIVNFGCSKYRNINRAEWNINTSKSCKRQYKRGISAISN